MNAEGWYQDPFGLHEARWISDGSPTALVRDQGTESHDAPPDGTFDGPLVPVGEHAASDGDDLRRAGQADPDDEIFDPNAAIGGVFDPPGEHGRG
jgi:hypothetical protein